jgi:hypothetical protein
MNTSEAAIVFPLLPGKRLALEQFVNALAARQEEHDLSHSAVPHESWFFQHTPQGDLVVVYLQAPDPMEIFAELSVSQTAFACWFREQVLELTGTDLALLPPFCLPERIFHRLR